MTLKQPPATGVDVIRPVIFWRKAKSCNAATNCVELAALGEDSVAMRNSRDPDGPVIVWTRPEFRELLDRMRAGDLDQFAA